MSAATHARADRGNLPQHFCAQVPHRQQFAPDVRRALAILDRVSAGEPISDVSVAWALTTTGDLDAPRLRLASRNPTFAEGQ